MRLLSPPKPTIAGYEQSGLIDFSDPKNIELHREVINTVVVVQKRMPFGNQTKMTQEERDRIRLVGEGRQLALVRAVRVPQLLGGPAEVTDDTIRGAVHFLPQRPCSP